MMKEASRKEKAEKEEMEGGRVKVGDKEKEEAERQGSRR